MLKRITLLGVAIAALVAIGTPAAQADFRWETNGIPIANDDTVALHGDTQVETTNKTAGIHATVTETLILFAGTHKIGDKVATVEAFHVEKCAGTVALAGTTCTPTTTDQDWDVYLRAHNQLEIIVNLHQLYWAGPHTGTPVATTLLTGGVLADIGPNGEIETVTLTGGEELLWNGAPSSISGELVYEGEGELAITTD